MHSVHSRAACRRPGCSIPPPPLRATDSPLNAVPFGDGLQATNGFVSLTMSRMRWALGSLLLGVCVCCVMGVGLAENNAVQQQRDAGADGAGARGEDGALDTDDRDPEYFVREDEVPQGLPPLQEEHAYFAALDLNHGVTSHPRLARGSADEVSKNSATSRFSTLRFPSVVPHLPGRDHVLSGNAFFCADMRGSDLMAPMACRLHAEAI